MCKHSFCLLLCDALRRTHASESPGAGEEALSLRQIMEAQSFKVECSASPCRILATMALSLPLSVPPRPFSPPSPTLMSTRGSRRQWQEVRRFHVRGNRGMSVTASRELCQSGNKIMEGDMRDVQYTNTRAHALLQTHFYNIHQALLLFSTAILHPLGLS